MRRFKQELTDAECEEILRRNTHGVLSLCDDDRPYGVPMSFARSGDKMFFHCAVEGRKIEILKKNPSASFCVVDFDDVYPEKYSTRYASVILDGEISILDDTDDDYLTALSAIKEKYVPDGDEEHFKEIVKKDKGRVFVLEMNIDQMHGKHGAFNDK